MLWERRKEGSLFSHGREEREREGERENLSYQVSKAEKMSPHVALKTTNIDERIITI